MLLSETRSSVLLHLIFFFTPLIFLPYTSELFEFNKMLFVYLLTGLLLINLAFSQIYTLTLPNKFIFISLLSFLTILILSTIFSIHPYTSIFGYYSRFHGGLLSYSIFILLSLITYHQNTKHSQLKYTLTYSFIISIILSSVYGIFQHFGIDAHIWKQDVQNRIFSTLGQPNWLALAIISTLPFTWSIPFYTQSKFNPKILFIISFITQFIGTLALFYTKSRSGLISLIIMSLTYWVLIIIKLYNQKTLLLKNFCIFIIVIILTNLIIKLDVPLMQLINPNSKTLITIKTDNLSSTTGEGGTESFEIRQIVWQGATQLGLTNPLLGTGPETFAYSYFWTRPLEHNYISEWDFIYNKAHNEILNFLATTGFLGTISYLIILITIGINLIKSIFRNLISNTILQINNLAIVIGLSISHLAGFSIVISNLALFILPIISLNSSIELKIKPFQSRILKLFSLTLGLFLIIFTLKIYYADTQYAQANMYYKNKYFEEASTNITKAINNYPYELNYHNLASKIYANLTYEQAKQGNNNQINDLYNLALNYSNYVLNHNPYNTTFLTDRAYVLSMLASFDETNLDQAIKTLKLQTTIAPTDPRPLYNLGLLYSRSDPQQTSDYLKQAIELKNNYQDAWVALVFHNYQQAFDENNQLIYPQFLEESINIVSQNPKIFPPEQWSNYLNKWQQELNP